MVAIMDLDLGLTADEVALRDRARVFATEVVRPRAATIDLASETVIKVVNDALQFFGARGYSRELPLERMARDVRMFTIGGGTAQVLRTLVASKMLGWKLPQRRGGYLPKPSMRDSAE